MENTQFHHLSFFLATEKKKIHDKDNRNRILEQLVMLDYDEY